MIGVQDFIRYYDWTFEYLRRQYGEEAVQRYWAQAIALNSQNHAHVLIRTNGLEGMAEYWGHTLASEEAGYRTVLESTYFRIDMLECPSKGLLIQIGQEEYHDYCQHCMGWIKPIMDEANFLIDHEHNHQGQCWWEMYPADDDNHPSPPPIRDDEDVRKRPGWQTDQHDLWLGSQQVES
jgi:hypothetical protein